MRDKPVQIFHAPSLSPMSRNSLKSPFTTTVPAPVHADSRRDANVGVPVLALNRSVPQPPSHVTGPFTASSTGNAGEFSGETRRRELSTPTPATELPAKKRAITVSRPRYTPNFRKNHTPRRKRVWRHCSACGHENHVRRLFCTKCLASRRRKNNA